MKRTNYLITLVLALLITSFAFTAFAGPIITVTQDTAGPIAYGETATFTVHYNPNDYMGELGAFTIQLANGAGDFAIFDDTNSPNVDVTQLDWPGQFFAVNDVAPYEITVDGSAFGTTLPAETEADLFSIMFHGDATGLAELNILAVTLKDENLADVVYDGPLGLFATLDVDTTPPDVPVIDPMDPYTAGTTNTVMWGAVAGADAYFVMNETTGADSGWIAATEFEFTGLDHNVEYCYVVKARDLVGNESVYSDAVCSTQDSVTPESAAGPLDPAYAAHSVDIPWIASDDMSGVKWVQLFYQKDGGGFMPYGTTFLTSPITFVAPDAGDPMLADGEYEFYTMATDNAGNVEVNPEADSVVTVFDMTAPDAPVMCEEPLFTPGLENTVCWEAVDGAVNYIVYCSNGTDSGLTDLLEWTFTGLLDGQLYSYFVVAYDALGNMSDPSAPESSTQDASAPWSSITNPPSGDMTMMTFDIFYDADDMTSGVVLTRLFYQLDGGGYVEFGSGFVGGVIPFDTGGNDGAYNFYTIAEDLVGNVEMAPLDPDLVLNVDTGGPMGTFVINNDDAYTTEVGVTLNYVMDDPSGIDSIDFYVNGVLYSSEPYMGNETEYDLDLDPVDGDQEVCAIFWDTTGNDSEYCDMINLDTTEPDPSVLVPGAGGIVVGHESITLNWVEDEDPGDLAFVEIWCSLWDIIQEGVGDSAYPEYNDTGVWHAPVGNDGNNGEFPVISHVNADPDWFLLATVPVGTTTFEHTEDGWARGAYSYLLFAKDNAGNYSHAHKLWPDRRVNYVLGDFDEDGVIDIFPDVTNFALAYGAEEGVHDAYNNIMDIGPLSGNVPATDNSIGFEDLMILSGSFNAQNAGKAASGDPETPAMTWYPEDENTWVLGLVDPCNSVKGIRLASVLPENVTMDYSLGRSLEGNSGYFLANDIRKDLDLGFAVLGHNMVLAGNGEILRVTTSEPVDLSKATIEVRNAGNESMEYELTAEPLVLLPTAYKLENNYPNPFNPETNIKFSLPEAQDVKLEIFDIKGYRVQVLLNESMDAGNHSVMWNGRDRNGRMVASGTYFYRIQAGPLNQTHRMLLVK